MKDVVIASTAMVCGLGGDTGEVFRALLGGRRAIKPLNGFDAEGFDCRVGGQVHPDVLDVGPHPRDARIMGLHTRMLLKCARDALQCLRLGNTSGASEAFGFFVGMGPVDGDPEDLTLSVRKSLDESGGLDPARFLEGAYREIHPLWPLAQLNNIACCQVATELGLGGENAVFSSDACAALQAIAEGAWTVAEGHVEMALAGGVSGRICPAALARAGLEGVLNTVDATDPGACRPFGEARRGTVLGEGCGILVLEAASAERGMGVRPVAGIAGYGSACERSMNEGGPSRRAIELAMESALADGRCEPCDLDLVIAHGDGTIEGDGREIEALNGLLQEGRHETVVFSSKGALGHLSAGGPAVDVVLAVRMIEAGMIPPTLHAVPLDGKVRFPVSQGVPLMKAVRRVLVNGRGQGGQCASLLLEAARP